MTAARVKIGESSNGSTETATAINRRATVTVTEAADILGISRSTAYELVRVGTLPALRLGRRLVVPTHALEALLDSPRPRSQPT